MSICVNVLNQASTKSLNAATTKENFNGRNPKIQDLRLFGSLVHMRKTTWKLTIVED